MAQQPSREFASTDPTTRIQDAGFQVPGVSPKISLNSRSHLQHFQRPTSSHFCKDAPSLSRVGYEQRSEPTLIHSEASAHCLDAVVRSRILWIASGHGGCH